jgi:hypothetical protein
MSKNREVKEKDESKSFEDSFRHPPLPLVLHLLLGPVVDICHVNNSSSGGSIQTANEDARMQSLQSCRLSKPAYSFREGGRGPIHWKGQMEVGR